MSYLHSRVQQQLAERYKLTSLIVIALGISSAVCMLLGKIVAGVSGVRLPAAESYGFVVGVMAAALGLLSILLRRFMLSAGVVSLAVKSGVSFLTGRLSMTSIIGAALGEVVGILGLIASMLTGDTSSSWRLGIVSLAMIAYSFPRRREWERLISAATASAEKSASPSA